MKKIFLLLILATFSFALNLQKAQTYNSTQNINNWLMSEKLDGIRAYWDGEKLQTRQGKLIFAPSWFTKNFPPFELDGELWTTRNDFENIQSIVLSKDSNEKWKAITYNIFEVPHTKGNFTERLKKAQRWFKKNTNPQVKIIPQKLCINTQELNDFLDDIIKKKGEGVMIKNPNTPYESGRTSNLLKVKKFQDTEGIVIGINYNNILLKSLVIELPSKVKFNLGNGFTKAQRQNPPKIGAIVTFKYYGLTKNQKPKFASFLHERKD
ncbi:MAG: DNA ligase [Arcobacteraceae bacterium]